MHRKIQYQSVDVHRLSLETLIEGLEPGSRLVVGVDVAKRKFLAAFSAQEDVRHLVHFVHPAQTLSFVDLLHQVQAAGHPVEVAMEPTGTYGDPLRYMLGQRSIPVFRVNNKHVHDAAELFDGSASKLDGKDCCVICWLHNHQRSTLWEQLSEQRRNIRALIAQRELFDVPLRRLLTQTEPLLARHFPELDNFFDLSRRKTPYRLLQHFGSAAAIAQTDAEEMTEFLRKAARRKPDPDIVDNLLQAAKTTTGVHPVQQEQQLLQMLAGEILRLFDLRQQVDRRIAQAGDQVPVVQALRPCLGPVTAAVIFAYLGAPSDYVSAAAFEKAAGLNLIERSSGENPGTKHISKRGAGIVRKYLFLAAMRLIQSDPLAKAWYQARSSFKANLKAKALIAVERKLCRALYHVAAGNSFDAAKLFDARRLSLATTTTTEAA